MPDLFDDVGIPQGETGAAPLSPMDLGLPPAMANVLGPSPQLPEAPPMPSAPPQVAQDPRQRMAMLATIGFMLGSGQHSGLAQGSAAGTLTAQGNLQQQLNARFKEQQADADKQQALLVQQQAKAAADERQRQQNLMTALGTIKTRIGTLTDKTQYDKEIDGYAAMLQSAGYRLDANWLRTAAPFVAPKASALADKAIKGFLSNPANKALLEQHPEELAKIMLTFDRDGDGVPEQVPLTLAAQIAGTPFATDASGHLMTYPKGTTLDDKANADGIFQTLLTKAKAEGKDTTDPTVRLNLQQQALRMAKEASADPLLGQLRETQLSQQPTPADAQSFAKQLLEHKIAPSQISLFGGFGTAGAAFKRMVGLEALKLDPEFNWEEAESNYQLVKSPSFQNTIRYMTSVQESIPRLQQTANALGNGKVRFTNNLRNLTQRELSNPTLKAFQTDVLLVSDEVAKILQGGGTGSGTSDAKIKQAAAILDSSDSPQAIAAALKEINTLIGYRQKALTRGTYLESAVQADPNASARVLSTDPNAGEPLRRAR